MKDLENEFNQEEFKYTINDPQFVECFVRHGFVIAQGVFSVDLMERLHEYVSSMYCKFKDEFVAARPGHQPPFLGFSIKVRKELENHPLYYEMTHAPGLLQALEKILGPDISKTCATGFFPVDPADESSPIFKELHQEIWTGCGPDDIISWTPLQITHPKSTLLVVPGSHLYGMLPNRNRRLLPVEGLKMPKPLDLQLMAGDIVLFHGLLLHGTSGKGDKIRYAVQANYRNTFTPLTNQQMGFGFINLKQGPMTRIRQVLGNDYLTPLRTYGGKSANYEDY